MKTTLFDESGLAAIYPGSPAWSAVQSLWSTGVLSEPQAAAFRSASPVAIDPPDGTAIVPVYGVITQSSSAFSSLFGGTSLDGLQATLMQLRDDTSIRSIVLHFRSPGGGVYGIDETADVIAEVRKRKRVVAFTDSMCASAAYWLASACERIVATPSAELGSIGVYAVHFDYSKQLAEEGVVPTLIKAGEHKAEGNPFQPLSDEDHAAMQTRINDYYSLFTSRVARGRGVSVDQVRGEKFGDGRIVGAKQAESAGMADEVGTFGDVIRGMTRDTSTRAAQAADSLLALRVRVAAVAC
jgi:signal peptide peptidase SppA